MKTLKKRLSVAIAFALALTIAATFVTCLPAANAQSYFDTASTLRKTKAYLSVRPHTVGVGQDLLVNMWVFPPPRGPYWWSRITRIVLGYENITITFTRPDGTKDTFAPLEGSPTGASGGLKPGQTEQLGAIYFIYKPNQIGTWSVQFSMPKNTFTYMNYTTVYEAATSPVTTFTVQEDPVQIGLPSTPLPTGYWERPVKGENREWYQISGNWLQGSYDYAATSFNPYSTAPNSPHILWKNEVAFGGLIGGDWGSISYYPQGGTPNVILNGKVYYNMPGGVFQCVDLRTGQMLYEKPGTITLGQTLRPTTRDVARGTPETQGAEPVAYLWELGSTTWKLYNPLNGALLQTITSVPAPAPTQFGVSGTFTTYFSEGDPVVYVIRQSGWNTTNPRRLSQNELIKWDYTKVTGNNWTTGIMWRASLKQADGTGAGEGARGSGLFISDDGTRGIVLSTGEDMMYGYDLITGAQLWTKKLDYANMISYQWAYDAIFNWDSALRKVHKVDIKTGTEVWVSDPVGEYPWASNTLQRGNAYGNIYLPAYDGYVYCMDEVTGKIKWKFYAGNTTETIFNNWVPYTSSAIADQKYYIMTSEHTPTQPRIRGNMLLAIDAISGKGVWKISGAIAPLAIAEGYLLGASENDGMMYAFGKGKTATTVSIQNDVVARGASVLLKGAVMDQSPAQAGTPAVSDASMSAWMDYLHMQKPMPTNVKGVPVTLTATAPDGSNINIGTTTSDGYGRFFYAWTPPNVGIYKIQATFAGSESYWSSTEETAVNVGSAPSASIAPSATATPAPATTQTPSATTTPAQTTSPSPTLSPSASPSPTVAPPPSTEAAPSMTLYIVIAAVAVVIVVAAVALILRKRK